MTFLKSLTELIHLFSFLKANNRSISSVDIPKAYPLKSDKKFGLKGNTLGFLDSISIVRKESNSF